MRYEWNRRKNLENQRKHGVSFELAALVFEDENCHFRADRVDESGEPRWHAIGSVSICPDVNAVLVVVHVYREDLDGEEIIRIISARAAGKDEIRRYQEAAVE